MSGNGSAAENSSASSTAITQVSAMGPTGTKPVLVFLEPGSFSGPSIGRTIPNNVDLMGSGEQTTSTGSLTFNGNTDVTDMTFEYLPAGFHTLTLNGTSKWNNVEIKGNSVGGVSPLQPSGKLELVGSSVDGPTGAISSGDAGLVEITLSDVSSGGGNSGATISLTGTQVFVFNSVVKRLGVGRAITVVGAGSSLNVHNSMV